MFCFATADDSFTKNDFYSRWNNIIHWPFEISRKTRDGCPDKIKSLEFLKLTAILLSMYSKFDNVLIFYALEVSSM